MNRNRVEAQPRYFWPLLALLGGILIGLIIGWWIWPVEWTNTYPRDLRAEERNEYLALVAEAYAANPNLALAQQRLGSWTSDEQAKLLADVKANALATDAKRATEVQLLSSALGLDLQPEASVAPSPAPADTQPSRALALLRTLCTAGLWILLVVGALLLFSFLFRQWRKYQQGATERPPGAESRASTRYVSPDAGAVADEIAQEAKDRWPEAETDFRQTSQPSLRTHPSAAAYEPDRPLHAEFEPARPSFVSQRTTPPPAPPRAEPAPEPPARRGPGLTKLGEFTAIYQGESDYDEAFDINDPTDGYMGQCGLQLNDPVGRQRDQAVALQAWLWDTSDPDTRVKVLMSEYAYRDTGLRSEQAGEYEALQVRPGTEFTLETYDLLLQGRVERVEYAEQEPYRGVFSELQVIMQVLRKS